MSFYKRNAGRSCGLTKGDKSLASLGFNLKLMSNNPSSSATTNKNAASSSSYNGPELTKQDANMGALKGLNVEIVETAGEDGLNRVQYAVNVDTSKNPEMSTELLQRLIQTAVREAEEEHVAKELQEAGLSGKSPEEIEALLRNAMWEKRYVFAEQLFEHLDKSRDVYLDLCEHMVCLAIECKNVEGVCRAIDRIREARGEKCNTKLPAWGYAHMASVHALLEDEVKDGKNIKEAEKYFKEVSKKDPNYFDTLCHVMQGLVNTNDKDFPGAFDRAQRLFKLITRDQELKEPISYRFACFNMMLAFVRKKDLRGAYEYFEKQRVEAIKKWGGIFSFEVGPGQAASFTKVVNEDRMEDCIRRDEVRRFRAACAALMQEGSSRYKELSVLERRTKAENAEMEILMRMINLAVRERYNCIYYEIIVRVSEGDFDLAMELLGRIKVRADDPGQNACYEEAAFQIGTGYLRAGKYEEADEFFQYGLDRVCGNSENNFKRVFELYESLIASKDLDEGSRESLKAMLEEYKSRQQDFYLESTKQFLYGKIGSIRTKEQKEVAARLVIEKMDKGSAQYMVALKALIAFKKYSELEDQLYRNIFPEIPFKKGAVTASVMVGWVRNQLAIKGEEAAEGILKAQEIFEKHLRGTDFEAAAEEGLRYARVADETLVGFCEKVTARDVDCLRLARELKDTNRAAVARYIFELMEREALWEIFQGAVTIEDGEGAVAVLKDLEGSEYEAKAKSLLGDFLKREAEKVMEGDPKAVDLDVAVKVVLRSHGLNEFIEIVDRFLGVCVKAKTDKSKEIINSYRILIKGEGKVEAKYHSVCSNVVKALLEEKEFDSAREWIAVLEEVKGQSGGIALQELYEYLRLAKEGGNIVLMDELHRKIAASPIKNGEEVKQDAYQYVLAFYLDEFERGKKAGDLALMEKMYSITDHMGMLESLFKHFVETENWGKLEEYQTRYIDNKLSDAGFARACAPAVLGCYDAGRSEEAYQWLEIIRGIDSRDPEGGFFLQPYLVMLNLAYMKGDETLVGKLLGMAEEPIKEFLTAEEREAERKREAQRKEVSKKGGKGKKSHSLVDGTGGRNKGHGVVLKDSNRLQVSLVNLIEKALRAGDRNALNIHRNVYSLLKLEKIKFALPCVQVVRFYLGHGEVEEAFEWLSVVKEIEERSKKEEVFEELGQEFAIWALRSQKTEVLKKIEEMLVDKKSFWEKHLAGLLDAKDWKRLAYVRAIFKGMEYGDAGYARMCEVIVKGCVAERENEEAFKWLEEIKAIGDRAKESALYLSIARRALVGVDGMEMIWSERLNACVEAKDWESLSVYRKLIASLEYSRVEYSKAFVVAARGCLQVQEFDEVVEWVKVIWGVDSRDEKNVYFLEPYLEFLIKGMDKGDVVFVQQLLAVGGGKLKHMVTQKEREVMKKENWVDAQKKKAARRIGRTVRHTLPGVYREIEGSLKIKMVPVIENARVKNFSVSSFNVWDLKKLKAKDATGIVQAAKDFVANSGK